MNPLGLPLARVRIGAAKNKGRQVIPSNKYHFVTRWKVKGSVQEVSDILGEPCDLVRWWPSVYLDVREIDPGDDRGIGKVVRLLTRGWLPYTALT